MNYITISIIFLILLLTAGQAWPDAERYRVEVLVLYHLRHQQEPREIRALSDYSYALDFLQPPEEETDQPPLLEPPGAEDADLVAGVEASAPAAEPVVELPGPKDAALLADAEEPSPAAETEDLLNAVVHVAEPGPEMQEAWRRLRLSALFRPLQYLAWDQGPNAPFPVLRVHDLEAVLVQDPWAEQRAAEQTADEFNPEDVLPDPITYYQLDGTASLTRSRFLHLALALEWREPLYDADAVVQSRSLPPTSEAESAMVPEQPQPTAFLVHRIDQRRMVRTGRMEYFDTPVLGVLAYVTRLEDALTEPEFE